MQRAIEGMNGQDLNGRKVNVELGGQIKKANVMRDPHVKEGTVKLHVSGIRKNGDEAAFRLVFCF